jgi:hypothetical protein
MLSSYQRRLTNASLSAHTSRVQQVPPLPPAAQRLAEAWASLELDLLHHVLHPAHGAFGGRVAKQHEGHWRGVPQGLQAPLKYHVVCHLPARRQPEEKHGPPKASVARSHSNFLLGAATIRSSRPRASQRGVCGMASTSFDPQRAPVRNVL